MILKNGVTVQGVKPPVWFAIGVAVMVYRHAGFEPLVVTSLTDSHAERPKSLHNKGLAVDFRTRNVPRDMLKTLYGSIKNVLDPLGYDVVLEADHLHCEYQPKEGESWISFEA